jgi:Rad3-related DNA helicase
MRKRMQNIFHYVPKGVRLRPAQRQILREVEASWEEYDVIAIDGPPATGKSLIAMVVSRWQNAQGNTSAILTPRTNLQDQYQRDHPDTPALKGRRRYSCRSRHYDSCADYHDVTERHCKNCPYTSAVKAANTADNVILNFHSHLFGGIARDAYKDVLIIDEAHNLVSMLADTYSLTLWKHKDAYPDTMHTQDDVLIWLEGEMARIEPQIEALAPSTDTGRRLPKHEKQLLLKLNRKLKKYRRLFDGIRANKERFHVELTQQYFNGKRRPCAIITPLYLDSVPHGMWPDGEVKKIVMMSATLYDKDLERLGILRKRVKRIDCGSAIPAAQRPFVVDPVGEMSYKMQAMTFGPMAKRIQQLAEASEGKGIVHLTYSLSKVFKKLLPGDRYLWHDEENKDEVFRQFLDSKDKVLMACGMSEGIDLAGNDYTWQAIAKTIFPSLGSGVNKHWVREDPEVYVLETVRTIVQQTGRICRSPRDFGKTIMLDKTFVNFYRRSTKLPDGRTLAHWKLFPEYFRDAMEWR